MANMSFDDSGFDELTNLLDNLSSSVESLNNSSVPSDELFTKDFLSHHSSLNSFDEFIALGNFHLGTQDDFDSIPESALDALVVSNTDFESWKDMLNSAISEYLHLSSDR